MTLIYCLLGDKNWYIHEGIVFKLHSFLYEPVKLRFKLPVFNFSELFLNWWSFGNLEIHSKTIYKATLDVLIG